MLRLEYAKKYIGKYVKTSMIVFFDDKLTENNFKIVKNILNGYRKIGYEFVEVDILFDRRMDGYLIFLVITCSRWLLIDVSEDDYQNFIDKHLKLFRKFYEKKVVPILG